MQKPANAPKVVLARVVDGKTEIVEWIRSGNLAWIVTETNEKVLHPHSWRQAWDDLIARGFVEIEPNDTRKLAAEKQRVLELVNSAFLGVTLGNGIGLQQGQGFDDYADQATLATYRSHDEKNDWSAIPVSELERCSSSLSYFDAEGMRFHLPAYLVADLKGRLPSADVSYHLINVDPQSNPRFALLSAEQREAVRQFLLLRLSDHDREFEHAMIEAAK